MMAACKASGWNSEASFSAEKLSSYFQEQEEQEQQEEQEEQEEQQEQQEEQQEEQEEVEEANRRHRPGVGRRVGPHRFGKLVEEGGSLPNQHHL